MDRAPRRAAVALVVAACAAVVLAKRRAGGPARIGVTINKPRADVEEAWRDAEVARGFAHVSFAEAPGGRGTEIAVAATDIRRRAQIADALRRFKQEVETGEVIRSESTPEGHALSRQLRQRPAQPLEESVR